MDQGIQEGQKVQMQQIAEGSWLDSWQGTMQDDVEDQIC